MKQGPFDAADMARADRAAAATARLQAAAHRMALLAGPAPLFSGHCCKRGHHVFSVEFFWPGVLRVHTQDATRDFPAACMLQEREAKAAALFMDAKHKGRPLLKVVLEHRTRLLLAVFRIDGVLLVNDRKTGELLAVSEPGRPEVLASGHFRN